jgi:hypothetical protein
MIEKKNIDWYKERPERLLLKKPFTRSGQIKDKSQTAPTEMGVMTQAELSSLMRYPISQDTYLEEYDPTLHRIKFNRSIPHIAVKIGAETVEIDDMTVCAAYQKNIHAAHVLHLTANPMDFVLCNEERSDEINKLFSEYKQDWQMRNMESVKYEAISKQKKVGDVGVLFKYDKETKKGSVKVYSYDEGYVVIPNYDEYGEKIATSLYYKVDGISVIDTYDNINWYHFEQTMDEANGKSWTMETTPHGFSVCPLLYMRGKVAWEFAESAIEMWELMANINAVALKRFGVFGLVLKGEMDENSFKRDSSTLIINLSATEDGGKQDAKTIEFPEPQKMIEYLEFLKEQISTFSSVSFITPKDITSTASGGQGIFLAMKNDFALATQSVADYADFTNGMAYLFQQMKSLESDGTNKYNVLKIRARLNPWNMESNNTKVTNLSIESKWLSKQTIIENTPEAAPDELERVAKEAKVAQDTQQQTAIAKQAAKSQRIATNNNSSIADNNKSSESNV